MIWHVSMISLGHKVNRWGVVLDYNNNFLKAIYVVLIFCYTYVIVIYDGVCVGDMLNIMCGDYISNTHENIANIMSTDCGSAWKRI